MNKSGRRSFIKKVAGTAALGTAIPGILAARPDHYTTYDPDDLIAENRLPLVLSKLDEQGIKFLTIRRRAFHST